MSPGDGAGDKSTQPNEATPAGVPSYGELVAFRHGVPRNLMAPELDSDEKFLRAGRVPIPSTEKEVHALVDRIVRDRYDHVVQRFKELPETITGYRAVQLPDGVTGLKRDSLGRYWSDTEAGAKPYHAPRSGGDTILLKGTINKGQLDAKATMLARMRSATGHDEAELTLNDGESVSDVSYKGQGETEWKPLSDTSPAPADGAEHKYKHGNTQADIPADSPAGRALATLRAKIDPADLMGEGLVEDSHITVRYGIQGDDTAGIRAYLEKQAPFEARLGSVTSFPPSEHSDGASPIVVSVGGSPELRRMEKELDKHGDFAERSFPDYKPHVTVAYVKPEAAKKYTGNGELQGETFTVKSVSITDRDGGAEEVELKGKAVPSFYKPKPVAETRPARRREPIAGQDGKRTTVLTPTRELPAKYRLVEADDLLPSHNANTFAKTPGYPEGLQERAYDTSKEAQSRVITQAQNYDPRYTVNTNPDAVNGPPIITPEGTVLGGNSRAMSTQRFYEQGGAVYRKAIKDQAAAYGLTPEHVDAMKKPVLVREISAPSTPDEARRIGAELNKSMTGALGVSERAVSAGKNIKLDTLRRVANMMQADDSTLREAMEKHGREMVRMLTDDGAITERERPQFIDVKTGSLSEEGKTFVERALMGSVIDDPRLMDAAPKSVLQKLERSIGAITSFASRADEWNLLPAIRAAVSELGAIQRSGSTVSLHLGQASLFGGERNPVVDAIVRTLDNKPNSVRKAFEDFARDSDENMPGQARMFGEAKAFDAFNSSFGSTLSEQEYHDGLEEAAATDPNATPEADAAGDEGVSERAERDAARGGEAGEEATKLKKPPSLGSTTYSGGFLDPELFKTLFPDIAERFKNWATGEITPGDEQREMMRQTRGERDRQVAAISKKLRAARNAWTFRPRMESIKFFNAVESGDLSTLDPKDRELAKLFQGGFRPLIEEIQELKPQALRSVIENYFPHIWEQPSMAAKTIRAVLSGRRPFAGSGSFLKQRTVPTMQDGIDMGLKPVSWNPVDLFLRKYAEMGQFLMAHKTLEMMKEAGTAKYIPVGTNAPEGWRQLDDRIGTVYGNPEIPVTEAFDKHVWNALMQTAQNILTATTRKTNIGGSRFGYYSRLDGIVTKANTQLSVLAHELGHAIDEVYGLKAQLVKHPAYAKELRALADLRIEDENGASDYYKKYIRKGEEKMAAIFEAYVHAPERFEQVAPNLYKHIQDFIASKPELAPLRELKRGLTYQSRQNTVNAGGAVIRGHYYATADAANVFNRYVSTGIRGRSAAYDTMRWLNDNMNSLQLGISAFHAATTSINAAVSEVALAVQQMSQGKPVQALAHAASGFSVAPAVVRTMVNGSRMMSEYLDPGSYRKFAAEASAIAEAGGRAKMDVVQISAFRKTVNAFRNGAAGEGLLSLPGTILQSTVAPVMDWMVPRMKLGAFYDMAHNIFDQADKHGWDEEAVRRRLQRAWDSVDNRFGQLVYENLFWHRALQDTLMLASRSVGWNFGDLRELGGGVADTARETAGVFQGKAPEVTPRMAFAMALPLVTGLIGATLTYLWTGKGPETWKDYFYPKRQDGTRVSIPGYMKDVVSFAEHPVNTVTNKMSPLLEMTAEAINNRDFYGTEIRHKDDPYVKQLLQVARWAAGNTEPFAISGAQKLLAKEGEDTTFRWAHPLDSASRISKAALHHPGDVALGQLGFQPAPASIQNSSALNMAREYEQANAPSGTRTEAEAERARAMRMVRDMYRSGKVDRGEVQSLVKSGVLSEQDRFHAQLESRTDPLVRAVKALHPEQALNVYRSATPGEQKELRPVIEAKQREIKTDVPRDQQEALRAAFRSALHPQPRFTGPSA